VIVPADPFKLIGTTIEGKYRIDAAVGEGGFGVVYKGFHCKLHQAIAVKCLKVPAHFVAGAKRLFFERFQEEGKTLAKLNEHLSIVRVYDHGVTTTARGAVLPYLVLEWLEGQDLEQVQASRRATNAGPFTEREAVALLRPVVDAVALAHEQGIAHRDIKPANLFLAKTLRGEVLKVLDFGIAKAMHEGETATQLATKTSSGFSAFSPQYGAPEQFYSKQWGPTGPWTDVYALGLVLVELVTGRPAYDGDEQAEFLLASIGDARPTPRVRGAIVSDGFEALCAKALVRESKKRFPDAGQLLLAVKALSDASPTAAPILPAQTEPSSPAVPPTVAAAPRSAPPTISSALPATEAAAPAVQAAVPRVPRRRRRKILYLLAVAGLLLAATLTVAIVSENIAKDRMAKCGDKSDIYACTKACEDEDGISCGRLAWVYERAGNLEKARDAWRQACKLAPNSNSHCDQLKRVEEKIAEAVEPRSKAPERPRNPNPDKCPFCDHSGKCTPRGDQCVATSDADCKRSHLCKISGNCTLRDGQCVAGSDQDCRGATTDCHIEGRCTAHKGGCVAWSHEDCRNSEDCKTKNHCYACACVCQTKPCPGFGCCRPDNRNVKCPE